METMIEKYKAAKRDQEYCEAWAALIGSPYRGGGGGVGELVSLRLLGGESSPTVYHQYSDGAKNYHQMPAALAKHLEAAIVSNFSILLASALKMQKEEVKQKAALALEEHAQLLKEAGIEG